MKVCTKCGEEKSYTEFQKRFGSKDGYRNECKACKSNADSKARKIRLSTHEAREKESARLQRVRDGWTEDRKKQESERGIVAYKIKKAAADMDFFEIHGCNQKEYKRRKDEQEFLKFSKVLNGENYDYSEVVYVDTRKPVKIFCNKHSQYFYQTPKDHKRGRGCNECGKESTGTKLRKSQEDFIKDALACCGDKYTFEKVVYVNNITDVQVTCRIHGDFPIRPANLLSGRGCPGCAIHGYNPKRRGSLYVLSCNSMVKVGITNRKVNERAKGITNSCGILFEIVKEFNFQEGSIPLRIETTLLRELRATHLQPTEKFDGSTECFYDVNQEWLLSRIEELIKEYTNATNRLEFTNREATI